MKKSVSSVPEEESNWQAESDVRTLLEADKIKADPARLKRAKAEAKKQLSALKAASL